MRLLLCVFTFLLVQFSFSGGAVASRYNTASDLLSLRSVDSSLVCNPVYDPARLSGPVVFSDEIRNNPAGNGRDTLLFKRTRTAVNWKTMTRRVITATYPLHHPSYYSDCEACDTALLSSAGAPNKHYFANALEVTERFSSGKTTFYILVHGDTLNYYTFESAQSKTPVKNGLFLLDVGGYGWVLPFFKNDTLVSWAFTGYKPFIPKKIKQTPVSETQQTALVLSSFFYYDKEYREECFIGIFYFKRLIFKLRQRLLCRTEVNIKLTVKSPISKAFMEINSTIDAYGFDGKKTTIPTVGFRFVDRYNRCVAEKCHDSLLYYYPSGAVASIIVLDKNHASYSYPEMVFDRYFDRGNSGKNDGIITDYYENGRVAQIRSMTQHMVFSESGKTILAAKGDSILLFRKDGSLFFSAAGDSRILYDSSGNEICSRKQDTLYAFRQDQKDTLKKTYTWRDRSPLRGKYYEKSCFDSTKDDEEIEYFSRFESAYFGTGERISNWDRYNTLYYPELGLFYFSIWLFMDYDVLFSTLKRYVDCDYNIEERTLLYKCSSCM
jgi:hypothetical protein